MRTICRRMSVVGLGILFGVLTLSMPIASAQEAIIEDLQKLQIVQLKVTSDSQFVAIFNPNSYSVTLDNYELNYLNLDNKPTKTYIFSGQLGPASYFVVSDGAYQACYLVTLESASMNFSTTGGTVQLWNYRDPYTKVLDDTVAWAKTKKSDTSADTLILPKESDESLYKDGGSWLIVRPNAENPCIFETITDAEQVESGFTSIDLLPGTLPPVRFVTSATLTGKIQNRNSGKMAPIINELLPNPASPQKDSEDEFIELYNPNNSTFDLTGFQLAFGSESPRKYTFPEGTTLKAGEFKAFTSASTSISLANSLAQAWLLDPNGKVIGQSDPYENAKDGQAWALNGGLWQWTSLPSPNDANTLTSDSKSTDNKDAKTVLGITSGGGSGSSGIGATAAGSGSNQLDDATPLHPLVLAGVGLLAVGYALYEYRHDIANANFRFRKYLEARRATRS